MQTCKRGRVCSRVVRVLLIDTCGEVGSVALADEAHVLHRVSLPARASSAELLPAIAQLMQASLLTELGAVGVVSGPGSFTGVRVGMAAAKGLCEGAGLRLVSVSRLAVLASVAELTNGYAVLGAGRGAFYVRSIDGAEALVLREQFKPKRGETLAVAEPAVQQALEAEGARMFVLDAGSALACVREALNKPPVDAVFADANYVRSEHDIYAAKPARGAAG
jgi:tRNA threonylcarbamoyladenosine biosynthesis protein TsaB